MRFKVVAIVIGMFGIVIEILQTLKCMGIKKRNAERFLEIFCSLDPQMMNDLNHLNE